MRVKFTEGPDALEIAELRQVVQRGEAVDVPNEVGKKLIDQGWEKAKASSPGVKKED